MISETHEQMVEYYEAWFSECVGRWMASRTKSKRDKQ